jgi:putative ABC transport system permease protein
MPRIPGIRRVVRSVVKRPTVEQEIDDELAFHFAMRVDELVARGMSLEQAHDEARRIFGDVAGVRQSLAQIDDVRRRHSEVRIALEGFGQDLRYALRGLRRTPVFSLGVIVILALGIGANAAVFTLIDRLLLRPPTAVRDPSSVARLYVRERPSARDPRTGATRLGELHWREAFSYPELVAMRDRLNSVASLAPFMHPFTTAFGTGIDAPTAKVSLVGGDFFRVLGARPQIGRFFAPNEDADDVSARVAVLGFGFWQRRFGGDSAVLGSTVHVGRNVYTVIGVSPRGFTGLILDAPDVWLPLQAGAPGGIDPGWRTAPGSLRYGVVARLRADASRSQVEALATASVRAADANVSFMPTEQTVVLASPIAARGPATPGGEVSVAARLMGAALMLLLITCANVANLLLARTLARRREVAVRLALGVGRIRLAMQLIGESVALAVIAGGAAALVAAYGGAILRAFVLPHVSWAEPPMDGRILAFTALVAVATGVLAGLLPAAQLARTRDVAAALKSGSRASVKRTRGRAALLIVQAALSMVLVAGAGLFARSLGRAYAVDLGFDPGALLRVNPQTAPGTTVTADHALYDEVAERVRSVPGVRSAAVADGLPYFATSYVPVSIPGFDSLPRVNGQGPVVGVISPEYLRTMRIRLVAGRDFSSADRGGAPRVALVNEMMARTLWPNASPLGRCLRVGGDTTPCAEVVGVVGDVYHRDFRRGASMRYYVPLAQYPDLVYNRDLVVRVDGDAERAFATLRSTIGAVRPGIERVRIQPVWDLVEPQYRPLRVGAALFTLLGTLALLVAAVGMYAVISFAVVQRTRELGVRVALGAPFGVLTRSVVGEGVRMTVVGVVLGVMGTLMLGGAVAALLFHVSPRDPLVLSGAAATLLGVAAVASFIPARRAARTDPMEALRTE